MADTDQRLSPAEAQALQDRDRLMAWVLTGCDPQHPGKLVARALSASPEGGRFVAAVLVADTLEALRAQMPTGVSKHNMPPGSMPAGAIELWD